MNKQEFLGKLRQGLAGLPQDEIEERLAFYCEMVDDRMEEGLSEVQAVNAIGDVDEIISQIIEDVPLAKLVKEKIKPKRTLKAWEIILLALGAPIWFSLLIAAIVVVLSLYVVLWSVMVSLWAVFGSFAACAFAGIAFGIGYALTGNMLIGLGLLSAGVVCAGLSIFLFFGCKESTNGLLILTKKIALGIKKCFVRKGENE